MKIRPRRMNEVTCHVIHGPSFRSLILSVFCELAACLAKVGGDSFAAKKVAMEAEDFRFLWEEPRLDLAAMELDQFKAYWKLDCVVGRPRSSHAFFRMNSSGLSQFALSHTVQRWDTLDSLVLKYDVQAMDIRKLNNMKSDYGVFCRKRLLIPITRLELLAGKTCFIEFDEQADCELAVIYPHGPRDRARKASGAIETAESSQKLQKCYRQICKDPGSALSIEAMASRGDSILAEDASTSGRGSALSIEAMTSRGDVLAEQAGTSGRDVTSLLETLKVEDTATRRNALIGQHETSSSSALTGDLWRIILERLPVLALGQAACVCRLWRSIAADPKVLAAAFRTPWRLKEVVGRPLSSSFWRGQLGQFVISHTLQRTDTIAGLAVKYRVQVPEIRRVNNMMSDHGIHSRERLLIPVSHPELLAGQTCFIETDTFAKREVGVLYLDGTKPDKKAAALRVKAQRRLKREVMESLKRSLRVDDSTAQYYFSLADGDLRGALQEFNEDLRWENGTQ